MSLEHRRAFESRSAYLEWVNTLSVSEEEVHAAVARTSREGMQSPFFGQVKPEEVRIPSQNYRETFLVRGLNARQRAILELLAEEVGVEQLSRARIYAPEAITRLALELRGRCPYFVGSEYAASAEARDRLYPVHIEDLQALSLRTGTFDVVLSCDVLEHVPDIPLCLSEMARILRPGGVMLSTHPFTWIDTPTVRARLVEGQVEHLMEPEYHGNPAAPTGSLVFTVPGWNILEQCRSAGFAKAEMVMLSSESLGLFSGNRPFLLNVLRARKA